MSTYKPEKEPMSKKAKTYWAIGIVCVVAVIALLVATSDFGAKSATAATVGEESFTTPEVAYYYNGVANTFIQQAEQYAAFGVDMGYDSSLDPSEQFYNEEEGVTYADYFMESALTELQRTTILCAEAEKAGFTMTEEGQETVDANMNYLTMYSVQSGMDEEAYLKAIYGKHMTKALFEEILADSILAEEYAVAKAAEFEITQDELEAYYDENTDALDSYEYRYCYINAALESTTDADGNTVEPTDEEMAAAMDAAKADADAMIASVRGGEAFNVAAAQCVDETSAEYYSADMDYNHKVDQLGSTVSSSLSADVSAWLMEPGRTDGEMTAIEITDTGYCVVQFLGRDKGDDSYQTATYRDVLILADAGLNEDGTAATPTADQLDDARDQANAMLVAWNNDGGDADAFLSLVSQSDNEATRDNGGLNEDVDRDTLPADVTEWLFARDRQPGDAAVLPYTDSTGAEMGYQLLFVESFGDARWVVSATNALQAEKYSAWYAEVQADYPAELTEDGKAIPDKQ